MLLIPDLYESKLINNRRVDTGDYINMAHVSGLNGEIWHNPDTWNNPINYQANAILKLMKSAATNRVFNTDRPACYKMRQFWEDKGIVPHYSTLLTMHPDVWLNVFNPDDKTKPKDGVIGGRANFFTDNAGNTIIFGFKGFEDSGYKYFNSLYNSGVLFKNYDPSIIQNNLRQQDRQTDGGWMERSVADAMSGTYYDSWLDLMMKREAYGKVPFPYIYMLTDVKTTTVLEIIAPYVLIALSLAASLVLSPGILLAGLQVLTKLGRGFISTGKISFSDITNAALSMPGIAGDKSLTDEIKKYATGFAPEGLENQYNFIKPYIETGVKINEGFHTGDPVKIAQAVDINNNAILKDIQQSALANDITKFAKNLQIDIPTSQKIVNSFQFSNTVTNLTAFGKEIAGSIKISKKPFNDPSIQGFFKTAASIPEVAACNPGSFFAVQSVVNNMETDDDEFISAIDLIQAKKPLDSGIQKLGKKAILAEAERLAMNGGKTYVIPNTVSEELQDETTKEITSQIKGIKVVNTTQKTKAKYKAFP